MDPLATFSSNGASYAFYDVRRAIGASDFQRLPYVTRVLAENLLRHSGRGGGGADALEAFLDRATKPETVALPLYVPRVILPDSSGIPVLMDLAALRSAVARAGGEPMTVDSAVPIAFVVDHSLQVDAHASGEAEAANLAREFERNGERYRFLKWAEGAFKGIKVFTPGTGIIHQVHLEQVAEVTRLDHRHSPAIAYPDFAIGGDSHTPMINALGVLGWGVGGIEAETVVLGQPYILPNPEVVGVRVSGKQREGVTSTDLALTLTEFLRSAGVVGAFIEFFGPGAHELTVPDRATLANMAPEYGATTGFWPVDEQTLTYLRLTGRDPGHVALIENHARAAGLFRNRGEADPAYHRVIPFDLGEVRRSIAGPGKPHNRQDSASVAGTFRARLQDDHGSAPSAAHGSIQDGAVAIAAITSCTNTANPLGMIRAGLLARAAVARGLSPAPWVKTSLAPGSRAVTVYLQRAELLEPLEKLGFHIIGYGCTTCGGKSGPLKPEVVEAVETKGRTVAAVLSGNRNFDGRIHRLVGASYLCSPALVVAYALAGSVMLEIDKDALARDPEGRPVFLKDLWPLDAEVEAVARDVLTSDVFVDAARPSELVEASWRRIAAPRGALFPWDPGSHYIVEPPFFIEPQPSFATKPSLRGARILGIFEDGLTTDHVSPGGEIPADSPAGRYLQSRGISPSGFNSYVGRRGNHQVMTRGTYANLRIRNRMVPEREGWWTRVYPDGRVTTFYEAATHYAEQKVPLVVLGGRDFGAGSSRDWAAKGPALLGVGAVIAESFERIHRSNLIGLGIVPLLFPNSEGVDRLGLTGAEEVSLTALSDGVADGAPIIMEATCPDGRVIRSQLRADVRSLAETQLLRMGGMFGAALRRALGESEPELMLQC